MGLTSYFNFAYGTLLLIVRLCTSFPYAQNASDVIWCPNYGEIEFATIKPIDIGTYRMYAIHIECNPGFELIGRHKLLCKEGKWEPAPRPQCVAQCEPPPDIDNGRLTLEGESNKPGKIRKGTLATYTCNIGYRISPPESKYRVCEKGIWTGALATCVPFEQVADCNKPKDIANGYYVQENNGVIDVFGIGQRLHYSCNSGYILEGPPIQQCLEDGSWSPRIPPNCIQEITGAYKTHTRPCTVY